MIANALDSTNQKRAAEQEDMHRQALRNQVIRYNAEGIDGLHDRPLSGRLSFLDDGKMAVFRAMILRGPDIGHDGVSRQTAKALMVPDNLSFAAFLSPYSPELYLIERLWLHLKQQYLSLHVWPDDDDILNAICDA